MVATRFVLARPVLLVGGAVVVLVVALALVLTRGGDTADDIAIPAPPPGNEAPVEDVIADAPDVPEAGTRLVVATEEEPPAPLAPLAPPAPAAPAAGQAELRVLVVDVQRDGAAMPVQGVSVRLYVAAEQRLELREETDEKGLAVFPLVGVDPEARHGSVRAEKDEHFRAAHGWASLAPDDLAGEPLELRRLPLGQLTGTVVDDFGAPIAGALVTLHREDETTPIEIFSAAEGTFVLEELAHLTGAPWATHEEYVLLRSDQLESDPEGGWRHCQVVMTRPAMLFVQVVDANGAPVVDQFVEVRIASSEKDKWDWETAWADARDSHGGSYNLAGWPEDPPQLRTDAVGEARFDGLWSSRRLSVHEKQRDRNDGITRVRDGVLVKDADSMGIPLVLEPGEQRVVKLLVAEPTPLRVEGMVLDLAGNPLPRRKVLVERMAFDGTSHPLQSVRSAADGRYECVVESANAEELLRVSAHEGNRYRWDPSATTFVGVALADPVAAVDGVLVVDVRCEPALFLAGHIVDAQGVPIAGGVVAEPEDASDPGLVRSVRFGTAFGFSRLDAGAFRIGNLGSGLYTLHLRESRSGGQWITSFPHLPAGAEELRLVVETPANVTIRVRAETDGVEVTRCVALLECLGPPETSVPEGDTSHDLQDLTRWPLQVPLGPTGNMRRLFMCHANEPAAHEWTAMRAGRFTVGLVAWISDEEMLYPVFGEPVDLGAGVHEFTAPLRRGGPLEGRVVGDFAAGSMAVALVDKADRYLPIFTSEGNAYDVMPCAGQGRFLVDLAPAGDFTLLVGTEEAIRAGTPARRIPVTIRPEGGEPLEVELR